MPTLRSYKTQIKVNNKETSLLLGYCGIKRFAWNWALARIQAKELPPNAMKLHKAWNEWKKENIPWWSNYSKAAPQEAFRDLQQAFQRFFNGLKGKGPRVGFPKFKSRHKSKKTFRLTGSFRVEEGRIKVPRIGWLRLYEKGYLPVGAKVTSVTISERAGRWFVSANVQTDQEGPIPCEGGEVLGIDLGIKTLAVCSDGQEFENPKALRRAEKALAHLQRRYARQEKGSKRRERTRRRIADLHYRISCIRSDALHKATTQITRTKGLSVVVLEDLSVAGMVKNRKLSKAISDASLSEFKRQITYKAERSGLEVVLADRYYPSSRRCSGCGHKKESLSLSERTYRCAACGLVLDRDLNAALNLRQWYLNLEYTDSSAGCGCGGDVSLKVACDDEQISVKRQVNSNESRSDRFV